MKHAARYSVAAAATGAILAAGAWVLAPQPTQLLVTARASDDTVVINQMHSAQLFASVIDQHGRRLRSDTALRYRRVGGESLHVSATGTVACERSQDAVVQADRATAENESLNKSLEKREYAKYCLTDKGARLMVAHGATGAELVEGTVALRLVW